MNVGIVSVDSKIPNLALMRLSAWHKAQGDTVEVAWPLMADTYDRVYRSKQFDFTPDDPIAWPCEVIEGGTGYKTDARLTQEQDTTYPDYVLFDCDYALGRITRGCIRRCDWCCVWRDDGKVHQVAELPDFWRGQGRLRLLDDNLTAMPDLFIKTCKQLSAARVAVCFESLDVRLMTVEMAATLKTVKRWKQVHFAWDNPAHESEIVRGIENLKAGGFPLWAATFYVLIGYNTTPEEDMHRIKTLHKLGVEVFVMPYDKRDTYQRRLARWCNHKAIFKTVEWEVYR